MTRHTPGRRCLAILGQVPSLGIPGLRDVEISFQAIPNTAPGPACSSNRFNLAPHSSMVRGKVGAPSHFYSNRDDRNVLLFRRSAAGFYCISLGSASFIRVAAKALPEQGQGFPGDVVVDGSQTRLFLSVLLHWKVSDRFRAVLCWILFTWRYFHAFSLQNRFLTNPVITSTAPSNTSLPSSKKCPPGIKYNSLSSVSMLLYILRASELNTPTSAVP